MKYNVGDLIASRDRIGLIVKITTNTLGLHQYEIEWQYYHSERIKYTNVLVERSINKILLLKNINKHLQVIE
jgi:hypothetical protein